MSLKRILCELAAIVGTTGAFTLATYPEQAVPGLIGVFSAIAVIGFLEAIREIVKEIVHLK